MDRLKKNLKILFIGYNPSIISAETGHHYANRTNRFWKIIFEAGITERIFSPDEDDLLLEKGIGFTNIVSRPTKSAAEITTEEYERGREELYWKIKNYQPEIAFFVGKGVYLKYARTKKANWGFQSDQVIKGVIDFVAPSSSGLVRMKMNDIVAIYKGVTTLL
ncbi:mismatch-specific DNA-glycosylase [Metabacillus malikii]|uniref:TDG/mug DNA glycosylase family protein n=1 Tax=Metabacillus malikii TaxID=1504265 RepID=A0ABT9ZA36_9BACI|nr:mismatch-specific DNA-glycosylase [Metabacillus malikii]MDQ0228900.1 TDG/mug DNA glycosylase family protein [Metabacillus malikii]